MATVMPWLVKTRARRGPGLAGTIFKICHARLRRFFDPYRPELHYMRGPGPKWREKQRSAGLD